MRLLTSHPLTSQKVSTGVLEDPVITPRIIFRPAAAAASMLSACCTTSAALLSLSRHARNHIERNHDKSCYLRKQVNEKLRIDTDAQQQYHLKRPHALQDLLYQCSQGRRRSSCVSNRSLEKTDFLGVAYISASLWCSADSRLSKTRVNDKKSEEERERGFIVRSCLHKMLSKLKIE